MLYDKTEVTARFTCFGFVEWWGSDETFASNYSERIWDWLIALLEYILDSDNIFPKSCLGKPAKLVSSAVFIAVQITTKLTFIVWVHIRIVIKLHSTKCQKEILLKSS